MKISTLILTVLFLFSFQLAHSQKSEVIHSFKITGKARVPIYTEFRGGVPVLTKIGGEMSVEYDSTSTDHLYILEFRKNGFLKTKTQLLFKGKKFNLANLNEHINNGELLLDGIHTDYREDETLASELLYNEEKLQKQTFFYPYGNKHMAFSGDEKTLNGEYKMWHLNGQLNFSGNYTNNLKNGEFQLLDESGVLVKKGVYRYGTLVSGDAVVQDLIYENPDKLAQYIGGDQELNEYLKQKSANFKNVLTADDEVFRTINLNLTVNKTGSISNFEILSEENPIDHEIIDSVFKEFTGFQPALVEDVPVASKLNLNLILTSDGLQTSLKTEVPPILENGDSLDNSVYSNIEKMPEFPGGEKAIRRFLSTNIRYPIEAAENDIQGKVFVGFIIEKDGSISNIQVKKGVHPLLDDEAVRIIKLMPRWIPGRQKGKPVRVSFTVPINFVVE